MLNAFAGYTVLICVPTDCHSEWREAPMRVVEYGARMDCVWRRNGTTEGTLWCLICLLEVANA